MNRREELHKLAQEISEILKNDYKVKRVFLIGSVVKGYVHDRSDIDLVVEGLAQEFYIKALTQIYDILPPGVEFNLIPFENAFETLREKTLREGMMLYG
jgi:predicted nucleotidyltransferase